MYGEDIDLLQLKPKPDSNVHCHQHLPSASEPIYLKAKERHKNMKSYYARYVVADIEAYLGHRRSMWFGLIGMLSTKA
jgi:hypothetical protein